MFDLALQGYNESHMPKSSSVFLELVISRVRYVVV
jgi:hypothetical protein